MKKTIESSFTSWNQNSSISTESYSISILLNSNQKKRFSRRRQDFTQEKKNFVSILFTTFFSQQHRNFFLSFSNLSFDFLFQQFRLSFFSDSLTFVAKSIFSSRLVAELNLDLDFSRIRELNDTTNIFSASISFNDFFSNQSSKIISIMSISEENTFATFNLTQQDIQNIVLSMFNFSLKMFRIKLKQKSSKEHWK
jgi:hypothetical protein